MLPQDWPTKLGAVLFDLDGTLVDSAPDLGAAANLLRAARGLPDLPLSTYRSMAGAGARGMLGLAMGVTPTDEEFESLREEFLRLYEQCMFENTRPFAGIAEVLHQLQRLRLPWGVVTNKHARFAAPLVRSIPLFQDCGVLICGDTTAQTKPHPEPLLEAARRLGVSPVQCVYVGDDARDIKAGCAAGMATVAASYGYLGSLADVSSWGAQAVVTDPNELIALLQFRDPA